MVNATSNILIPRPQLRLRSSVSIFAKNRENGEGVTFLAKIRLKIQVLFIMVGCFFLKKGIAMRGKSPLLRFRPGLEKMEKGLGDEDFLAGKIR